MAMTVLFLRRLRKPLPSIDTIVVMLHRFCLPLRLQVDVFSFGVMMWEILTGEEPYADLHYGAIIGIPCGFLVIYGTFVHVYDSSILYQVEY